MAYKKSSEAGMFDQEFTLEALSGIGNPLSALKEVLDLSSSDQYLSLCSLRRIAKAMPADVGWILYS